MTKKKVVGKNQKRRNETAHRRAIADPTIRKALGVLESNWESLSHIELGESLNHLTELDCSIRGMSEELKKKPTTISRYIDQFKSSQSKRDSVEETRHTRPDKPKERTTLSSIEAAKESKAMFARSKALGLGINKPGLVKEPQSAAKTQPAAKTQSVKLASSSALIAASGPSLKSESSDKKVTPTQEVAPKTDPPDIYQLAQTSLSKRIQRLVSIPEQIKPRQYLDARSMKRQGKP